MNPRKMMISPKNIALYLVGFFIIGLGVNVMKASALGNGAWDTVTINVRSYLQGIIGWEWVTLGMISLCISTILFLTVLLYRKDVRFLFMIVPIILVAVSIDFWNIVVFDDRVFSTSQWYLQIVFYVVGILILPLGLTLVIKSTYPAFVFDELMRMLVRVFHAKKITYVRLLIELTGLTIGTIFGVIGIYTLNGTLGAVNWGSILFTILFSPIMTMWFFILQVPHNE